MIKIFLVIIPLLGSGQVWEIPMISQEACEEASKAIIADVFQSVNCES